MTKQQATALIMAGGTGGHIFPGIAVANELVSRGWNVAWLGSKGGMEESLVADKGFDLNLINISGLRGNGLLGWLTAPFSLTKAIIESVRILKDSSPTVVVGFGGFASGPGGIAAFITGTPLVIHEQNAIAGLTNKVLSKIAKMTFQAFPGAFKNKNGALRTVGNPVRKEILNLNRHLRIAKKSTDDIHILVVGGSRGALALNQYMPEVFSKLDSDLRLKIKHQAGKNRLAETKRYYAAQGVKNSEVVEFIDDMAEALLWADLIVCRSGASTVAEIAASGVCAIFVPFPYAVDDHQTANAQWLVKQQAALCFSEKQLNTAEFVREINRLIKSPLQMNQMGNNAKANAYLNATNDVANYCDELNIESMRKTAA